MVSSAGLPSAYAKGRLVASTSTQRDESPSRILYLQDRLFSRLLQQIVPVDDEDVGELCAAERPARPPFSLPTMTNNFRRFNARIGIVFHFQNRVVKLLTWTRPTETWSFLFVYSFTCLDPYLLVILPLVMVLFAIMIPAFLTRHPPPPPNTVTSSTTPYYSYEGPALAPPKTIRPVPETSKDFFHNLRDLQNSMADFSTLHDATVAVVSPTTNFSDEAFSSLLFLLFTLLTVSLFLTAHLLPWRLIFLIGGNTAILSAHPRAATILKIFQADYEETIHRRDFRIWGLRIPLNPSGVRELLETTLTVSLDSDPEEREVEIFELQHRTLSPFSGTSAWEPFLFIATPYDPLSPSRIAGDRPKGTRFFEDVRPPHGWVWKGKKWELDLECREWVLERMVTGVEFEVPSSNGDGIGEEVGGWVWDLPFQSPDPLSDEADSTYDELSGLPPSQHLLSEGGSQNVNGSSKPEWEEAFKNADRTGEWRRRRWVRIVQRIKLDEYSSNTT
ncbi:Peroxisome size and maintenance regulator [Ophidiomyces ophidiicola]|nr:Peroxisome size and maintenance regulator [Ophidiomyces ophidiicola]KAI2008705.1 Peroxisome size and maintenance regulator [Ophidiomyces ophidiicola]KAI2011425.1 Peroxisome size and maintenance regulator [Ophidiomyces ophidiicola]KAI2016160.1 Peroxisome size and maintenance regulator [Ophidiomyces ophidiicola]KAI2049748.1 Peroxisome size and maintenance regulator [Ophidiomyces ophidiicola]